MATKIKTKSFSIRAILRGQYTYTATVDALTGKLVHIRAGCRTWGSFDAARKHYDGVSRPGEWPDNANADYKRGGRPAELYFHRWEAREILWRLDASVSEYAYKIAKKKKAAAKAKRPAAKTSAKRK